MFRNYASKAGLVGLALVVGAVGLEACSSSDSGTPSGSGGTTSTGGTSAHAGTSSTTGGTGATAGTTGVAGTSSTAGTTGTAGTGAGGASATGPFACAGVMANCNAWTTFPQSTTNSWGNGTFTGGITVFGSGLTRDAAVSDGIHVSGMVTGYGYGFGLYFSSCSDLSKYTGVSFKVKAGNATTTSLVLQVQTNPDYPFIQAPADKKGGCVATDTVNPFGMCIAPSKSSTISTTESTVTVMWADLAGGMPNATLDPTQILGIQWALPWMPPATAYAADVTVSDVTLLAGTGPVASCAMGTGGSGAGGAGGTGGAATGGGGAGGSGGSTAGSGGTGGH